MASEQMNGDNGNGTRRTNRDLWEKLEGMAESLVELKVRTEPLAGLPVLAQVVQRNTDELGRHHDKLQKLEEKVQGFEKLIERFRGRAEEKITLAKTGAFIGVLAAAVLAAAGVFEIVKGFM